MALIFMVGSAQGVRATVRVCSFGRFTAPIGFGLKFASCGDVMVSARLWLILSILWSLK